MPETYTVTLLWHLALPFTYGTERTETPQAS